MRTPAGSECPHYYEDYNRGRELQECRLARLNPASLRWQPKDCARCPVPEIVRANASPTMKLTITIGRRWLGLGRQVTVTAHCTRHHVPIENPYVGCPLDVEQNPALKLFREALDDREEKE